MKRTMCIVQVIFFAIMAGLSIAQTIGSIIAAGEFAVWQVGFGLISVLLTILTHISVRELKECNK